MRMNPYEIFKDKLKREQEAKEAAAKKRQADSLNFADLEETIRQMRASIRQQQQQSRWSGFGQTFTGTQSFTSGFTKQPTAPYTPGWCKVLGLPPGSTQAQIKAAYRKLAMKHHPDKGGDAAMFNKINKAYQEAKR